MSVNNVFLELEELICGEKEILLKKNIPMEQMMEYLGYEKLTEEMLEKYVDGYMCMMMDGWRWSGKHLPDFVAIM